MAAARLPLRPETREAFMKALDGLRAAGATVVFDDSILPDSFAVTVARVGTVPYIREGTEKFLAEFGPAQYHSAEEYQKAVGSPLPATIIGGKDPRRTERIGAPMIQAVFESDPQAEANVLGPRQKALDAYNEALDRLHLDGYVYPATQMPPPDETMPQDGKISGGPHSDTGWVNMIGVPAVVVPGGFYPEWPAVRPGDFGPAVERRRPARLGVCIRAGHPASQAAGTRCHREGNSLLRVGLGGKNSTDSGQFP